MIKINLLPYRDLLRKESIITHAVIAGVTIFLVFLLIGVFNSIVTGKVDNVREEIAAVEGEIASNKVSIDEIKKLKDEKEVYQRQFNIIENLKKGKQGPVRILDELATHIPDKLWILSLKQTSNNLEIVGIALDNRLISKFMTSLEESPYFKKVDLIASEMKIKTAGKKKEKLKRFTITCLITTPSKG